MYLIVFLTGLLVDLIPVFGPPTWVFFVALMLKLHLNVFGVIAAGVAGSAAGRLILTTYIHKVSKKLISRREEQNLAYIGRRLGRSYWEDFVFVFLYCLTPLSTAALFTAAGIAEIKPRLLLPPYVLGRLAGYGSIIYACHAAAPDLGAVLHGALSWRSGAVAAAGLSFVLLTFLIDWKALLHEKRLRLEIQLPR
jgi:membrane protein YqaA with SNARE-associated domain